MFSFVGEIGMVSSGTGELDLIFVWAEVDMAGTRVLKAEVSISSDFRTSATRVTLRPW